MSNGYRTLSQHLNDLKKENFSLKLRIYFLEERIQQKYEESSDDVHRRNIELKVEVESLKQELQEKQHLLDKALTTAESLTNHNEAELQRRCEERQQEIDHMQEVLETKIQLLQEEAQLARCEAVRVGSISQHSGSTLELRVEESPEERSPPQTPNPTQDKDRVIEELTFALRSKEALISELSGEKAALSERVGELEETVQDLASSLVQKEKDAEFYQDELGRERLRIEQEMQSLIEEQQTQLNQYECAAGQCVSELQKAQLQVQSLQAKMHESEANNQKLQEKLSEMECELRSIRQAAHTQEQTIQGLTESVSTKDSEAQELYQLIEGQNATLCKLREMAHRTQLGHIQTSEEGSGHGGLAQLQEELVEVQTSLFSAQLDLEASQRTQRQSERQTEDHARARERLQGDLHEALLHRQTTENHNQDLRSALQQARADLQVKEIHLKESEAQRQMELQDREKSITQLKLSLQDKERLLQEYTELLEHPADSTRPRDVLMDKLRQRIKDRDKALERSIDEKFRCLEEKEEQVRRLQLALREKERDLERLRCILSNNEETITSLDALVRGRDLELEQAAEALRNLQWLQTEKEQSLNHSLRERDTLISQLQGSLHTQSKEMEDLTSTLLEKVSAGPSEVMKKLSARLQLKEHLFQEVMSDRNRQAQEHHTQVQDLLHTVSTRDQYIKDSAEKFSHVIGERSGQLQELRKQLSSRERELGELARERDKLLVDGAPLAHEVERLQSLLKEKESFIQELMQGQEEAMVTSGPEGEGTGGVCDRNSETQVEVQDMKEELQLVLKKEKQAQLEVSTLQSALAQKQQDVQRKSADLEALSRVVQIKDKLIKDFQSQLVEPSALPLLEQLTQELQELRENGSQDPSSTDNQVVLEQLVEEYHTLNSALRVEKRLYQKLSLVQSSGDSSEKTRGLHTELDTVQALRGQLEEVLARTRDTAMALERAAKAQPDSGELGSEEEDEEEDGSSEDFSDSIEDDDLQLTAQGLTSTQTSGVTCERGDQPGGPGSRGPTQEALRPGSGGCEVQRLVKQKRTVERELKEQLEKTGYASLTQMRGALLSLRLENEALKEVQGRAGTCRRREQGDASRRNGREDEEEEEAQGAPQGKRGPPTVPLRDGQGKRQCTRPNSLDLGALLSHQQKWGQAKGVEPDAEECEGGFWQHVEAGLRERVERLRSELELSTQENVELQERLMVSEATVQAQAEQLKDYRELLTETAVQQDSKQVQVDLQDLGYETCGRSENEAEREDASSPEFDDLEMCTALSQRDSGGKWWCGLEDASSPQQQIQDLRGQLSRCHKVIRGLQGRLRSLSSTSDYASSLERPPRKVNWAFEASPAHSAMEEDEGWQSDGLGTRPELRPSRELQELVSRVASLEAQLKSSRLEGKGLPEEEKCATWPGKYNTLIQAQARELSHLRQKMREGRGVCHILTQHLGDTTKAFEELLRANDIDYYMGQSFREQLAQSGALAQRVSAKISGRDRSELHDDKMGHELLALRLSKELQQKDMIIESLHTKLQQRPDTPSSSHALSETTDQSDRTSFMSDERGSTNEDLELCSDVDVASEYAHEEAGERPSGRQAPAAPPPPLPHPHGAHSSSGPPSMPCSPHTPVESQSDRDLYSGTRSRSLPLPGTFFGPNSWGQHVTFDPQSYPGPGPRELESLQKPFGVDEPGFLLPQAKTLSSLQPAAHPGPDPLTYNHLSQNAFHQYQLTNHHGGSALRPKSGPGTNPAFWNVENVAQPIRGFSGSSGYQSGSNHTGIDLIEEHLREIRTLRQRLEESIRTNERLRQQLEERMCSQGRDGGAPTNIYIQGLDSVSQLSSENRALKEENLGLQSRLQISRAETCEEAEQLREAVLTGRARLKQAELEAEQWKEELRRLQTHSCEQGQKIQQLRLERQASQEHTNKLQHELSLLQQQLCESRQLMHSLQSELQLDDRMCANAKGPSAGYAGELQYGGPAPPSLEVGDLLGEVRSLRSQLQRSVQENGSLKHLELHKQLEQQLMEPRPTSLSALTASPQRDVYRLQLLHEPLEPQPELEGEAPDGSFAHRNGRHAVGHVDDFSALQQQILEGRVLVQRVEAALQSCNSDKALDHGCVKGLLTNAKTLRQILEEAVSLLKMFWRAALPSADRNALHLKQEWSMKEQIQALKLRISEQEDVLHGTVQRLRSTNRTKESMEHFIISQLSRTRDVLKKARANLEQNELRISSLCSSSSSPCDAEDPGGARDRSPGRGVVKPRAPRVAMAAPGQQPANKCSRHSLLQVVAC